MKKVLESLKKNKYFTLFFAVMLMFAYIGGARKYIYDNCAKAIDLARYGSPWFNLSGGMAALFGVAICVGVVVALIFRKKVNMNKVYIGYILAGIVSILAMLFTPYNLQLLSPSTHMDAFATLTMIAVLIFSLVTVALISVSIVSHILFVTYEDKMIGSIIISAELVFAALFAILCVALNWSLQNYIIVLTVFLFAIAALNILLNKEERMSLSEVKVDMHFVGVVIAVAIVAIIATIMSSVIIVEKAIIF